MSKPSIDDDVPPEPAPLEDDLPPPPAEPSLRSSSRSAPPVPLGADPPAPALAEELLGSADQAAAPSITADGDILTVGGAKYRIARRLGAGGMGEVFLARKLGAGGFERDVALKTVLPVLAGHKKAAAFLKGFIDEARLAALLHHNNICQVYDLQPLEGRGLIQVLEYIPGHSLKTIIEAARRKRVALTEPFACYVAAELASALDYAHRATNSAGRPLGIVHRDVTPHNVMLTDSGSVKLLDFGIAFSSLEDREGTTSNMVKGKDQYYAPEQLIGAPLDGRTDEFTLGLCLYEMLLLKRFFGRSSTDTETQLHLRIAQLTPESVEEKLKEAPIDTSLKNILLHALAPSREERFATCGEFADALRVFTQRRGLICTAAEARNEVEALLALPDAPDSEKTSPSGNRLYSVQPRQMPKSTMRLPALTPGRTASTPPVPPVEAQAAPAAGTPTPIRQLEKQFFGGGKDTVPLPKPESSVSRSKSKSKSRAVLAPQPESPDASQSALRRRLQMQDDLHNPKSSAKKMLALPAAILLATLLVGVGLVKVLLLSSPSSSGQAAVEVVKTPEQLRAQHEADERAAAPAQQPPPELAPVAVVEPSHPVAAAPLTPAPTPRPSRRPPAADAKAVDALLAQQYGGRPVVSPDAPLGTVVGAPSPATPGGRRRSYDTEMIAPGAPPVTGGTRLAKGTSIAARLTTPADSSQPSPVTATVTADVVVDGTVAVPKGTTVVCMTSPQSTGRLGLSCDTLNLRSGALTIEAIALGADRRVGLPLPRVTSSDTSGDAIKEGALNTARNVLGRATPDGVPGDVVQGAADTATNVARGRGGGPQEATAPLVPAGTAFTLFLQQPTN